MMATGHVRGGLDDVSLVDVGGYRLAFRQAGHGLPTVVLETGLGAASSSYDHIAHTVTAGTGVVWYDHASVGRSDPAPCMPRTIADLAADLHALLRAAQIPQPYVLVGHSLGGLTVRYYQQRYPTDVVALVLIDAAHEHQRERLLAALPPETADEPVAVVEYRMALSVRWADPMANAEGIDNLANSALMRQCGPLGKLPLVVVSRGRAQAPAGLPPDLVMRREQTWRHMQGELAALSSRRVQLVAEHSGHLMNEDQPEMIVEAIHRALALVREPDDHAPGEGTL